PRVREARQGALAQRHHPQIDELDRLIARRMAEPRAMLDEKGLPDALGIVASHRDRHLVALPRESTIGVAEQRAAGYLAPPLLKQRAEGRPEVPGWHVVERAVKRGDQVHAFGGGGQAQRREGSRVRWD